MLPKALKAKINGKNYLKFDTFYRLGNLENIKLNDSQKEIISLFDNKELLSKDDVSAFSPSRIKTLINKGVLLEEKKEHYRISYSNNTLKKMI